MEVALVVRGASRNLTSASLGALRNFLDINFTTTTSTHEVRSRIPLRDFIVIATT